MVINLVSGTGIFSINLGSLDQEENTLSVSIASNSDQVVDIKFESNPKTTIFYSTLDSFEEIKNAHYYIELKPKSNLDFYLSFYNTSIKDISSLCVKFRDVNSQKQIDYQCLDLGFSNEKNLNSDTIFLSSKENNMGSSSIYISKYEKQRISLVYFLVLFLIFVLIFLVLNKL